VPVLNLLMKHILIILSFFISIATLGQVTVTITPDDTTICYRDSIEFTAIVVGAGNAKASYLWQKNMITIPGATDSVFKIIKTTESSPGLYRVIVSVPGVGSDTSNDAILRMHPRMFIDTLYRYNPLGCSGECKGQFKALVSGGTPFLQESKYIYEWHGGHSQDTLVFGLCPGHYKFTVTDSLGCSLDSAYFVDYLKSPKVDFEFKPGDTIFLTNPTVQVIFPDSMKRYLANWTWDFGDSVRITNQNPVSHTYGDTLKPGQVKVKLSFTDLNGCDTTIVHELAVKVAELDIPNLFTPNGDEWNQGFAVEIKIDRKKDYREAYLSTELYVYDRWGRKVYNKSAYKTSEWEGDRLSDGTYFYILKCHGQYTDDVYKGSVTILRGN